MVLEVSAAERRNPAESPAAPAEKCFVQPDWAHPVFWGCVDVLPELAGLTDWPDLAFFNGLGDRCRLVSPDGKPLTFVHQPKKPSRWRRRAERKLRYEETVLQHAVIPMRLHSWHDFFNNLSWLMFPAAKLALVERLAFSSANRTEEDDARGFFRPREGDRLVMLDEGGVFQVNSDRSSRHVIFGHALQESFVLGRLDVWSLTVQVPETGTTDARGVIGHLDTSLANLIRTGRFAANAPSFPSSSLREIASHRF